MVLALQEWRRWLERTLEPFLIWTDHNSFAYLRSTRRLNSRHTRWSVFLSRFDFTLSFRPDSRNGKPNAFPADPDPIVPSSWIIGAVTWEIETTVLEVQCSQPDNGTGPPNRLFMPEEVHSQVLQWGHSSRFTCHPGAQLVLQFLWQHFWWPSQSRDMSEFVAASVVCA